MIASGLNMLSYKPANPIQGDTYFENQDGRIYTFVGNSWCEVMDSYSPQVEIDNLNDRINDLLDYLKYKEIDTSDYNDFVTSKRVMEKLKGE